MPEVIEKKPINKKKNTAAQYQNISEDYINFLKNQINEVKEKNHDLETKISTLRSECAKADQQVIKIRASTSYKLGCIIKNALTSFKGLISSPLMVWRLYVQNIQRVNQNSAKTCKKINLVTRVKFYTIGLLKRHTPPRLLDNKLQTKISALIKKQDKSLLKVASIMDEFTLSSFQPECEIKQLSITNWENELEAFQPQLLLIESAWHGLDNQWYKKVNHISSELKELIAWCKQKAIPTAFWNKEDPVHYQTFLNTAQHFDYVFTTDFDCIHLYKAALGHDHVYFLPFACQPTVHNPLERYHRKNAISFAGAYYVNYPDRTHDLEQLIRTLPAVCPVDIYDRNYKKNDPAYQFPIEYKPYIVGSLPFNKIDQAYKGYQYSLNLNSIKQSQTMFARRVFELLACNTLTISNFSQGLRLLFGDLVASSDKGSRITEQLKTWQDNPHDTRKIKLAGLRKVMLEHTYEHRLDYICAKTNIQKPISSKPFFIVLAKATTQAQAETIISQFLDQSYEFKKLILVVSTDIQTIEQDQIHYLNNSDLTRLVLNDIINDANWVTSMLAEDYYGPNYLLDIALATRYCNADLIGKSGYFLSLADNITLKNSEQIYKPVEIIPARRAAIKSELVKSESLESWLENLSDKTLYSPLGCGIDPYNYCASIQEISLKELQSYVNDLSTLNLGLGIKHLQSQAERIVVQSNINSDPILTCNELFATLESSASGEVDIILDDDSYTVKSYLPSGQHEYLYNKEVHKPIILSCENKIKCYFDVTTGLDISLVVLFLDAGKRRIEHKILGPNKNISAHIPNNTSWLRFGLRVLSSGTAKLNGVVQGHRKHESNQILSQTPYLVITNHYPAYDDYYRNAFVHSRVKKYKEQGISVDVYRFHPNKTFNFSEFENINIMTGGPEKLDTLLSTGRYKSILVHFLDEAMWKVLNKYKTFLKITVWVHGAEIQPMHRRDFNYNTDSERALAKIQSEQRIKFWKNILQPMPANLHLVFVSKYFMEEVSEDLELKFSKNSISIIHNPIDTKLFTYSPKPIEQRKKILSIRPYASAKYANDLSVKAIVKLSKETWFNELEFKIIGDGVLFKKTVEPLLRFNNVHIEQRLLSQTEISKLHKEYGIFLCPTRMDSQGVSRDEAMSSGLIPVTNNVTAIPEFVDDTCGILAPAEDIQAMVEGITKLYHNPELFSAMSIAAAQRVRQQSAADHIVLQEIEVANLKTSAQLLKKKGKDNKVKIIILGCSTTRDAFKYADKNKIKLLKYFARSSLASAYSAAPFTGVDLKLIKSEFRRNLVSADLNKTLPVFLNENEFDLLVYDAVDERFNLLQSSTGELCTISVELLETKIEINNNIIYSDSDQFYRLWEQAWSTLIAQLDTLGKRHCLRINKVYGAMHSENGQDYSESCSAKSIKKRNDILEKLYQRMAADIQPHQFCFIEDSMIGADKHKWGRNPFHFIDDYYKQFINTLLGNL